MSLADYPIITGVGDGVGVGVGLADSSGGVDSAGASGVLIGCLGVARIPYSLWMKWIFKWILCLLLIGFLLLLPTLFIPMAGF